MWHEKGEHLVPETRPGRPRRALKPNASAVAAVQQLGQRIPIRSALFDRFGHLRSLSADYKTGLFAEPMLGTPSKHAQTFLAQAEIHSALSLGDVELARPGHEEIPNMGYRVTFAQEVLTEDRVRYRVRESYVHVHMDESGKVYDVNSTLKHAPARLDLSGIINETRAIAAAKADLGALEYDYIQQPELLFSEHNGYLEPCYEFVITANNPRKVVRVLVTAKDGKVVNRHNLLRAAMKASARPRRQPRLAAIAGNATTTVTLPEVLPKSGARARRKPRSQPTVGEKKPVMAQAFLRIPDPNVPINKQLFDVVLERLPDPGVLQNDNLVMYVGSKKTPVRAKSDGTYNYPVNSPEFCAVATFFSMDSQIEYMKSRGLKKFPNAIPVFVEDRSVTDNAYFDPEAYEIHIGVGSGLRNGGLNRYICYDYGVAWHENGHNFVFVQTPGNDLPGSEGGGIHEAVGDVSDLALDWLFRLRHKQQLNEPFDVAEVDADRRVIGVYAAPPDGIRIQKNDKKTPGDKTGEPHDDGLIVGGAMADLMVELIKRDGVQQGIDLFATMLLSALAIVPSHKVTFRDLLNAFLTADNKLNSDGNKDLITRTFGDHGIKLTNKSRKKSGGVPVIVINDNN